MIWAPPLLHPGHQVCPVMKLVSLPLASAHPAPLSRTVQQTPPLSMQAMFLSTDGVPKQRDPSWGEQFFDSQASEKAVWRGDYINMVKSATVNIQ